MERMDEVDMFMLANILKEIDSYENKIYKRGRCIYTLVFYVMRLNVLSFAQSVIK